MELKLELNDDFVLDGTPFSGPGEVSFSSTSSFTSASPTTGPFTPISGRSTPPLGNVSTDFGLAYFPSDGLEYCVTPPLSGEQPTYFPVDSKLGLEMDFSAAPGFPSTSSGFAGMAGLSLAEAGVLCSTPPHHALYFNSMTEGTETSVFTTPMSSFSPGGHHGVDGQLDAWPAGAYAVSPIAMFETAQASTPPRMNNAVRRLFVDNARKTSARLQRQVLSNGPPRSYPKRIRAGTAALPVSVPVTKAESPMHPCTFPGCDGKRFKRLEHLKRHAKTHDPQVEYRQCEFCTKAFKARPDNYRQHLTLHMRPSGKNSRVMYYEEAKAVYEKEMRKLQERKSSTGSSKRKSSGTTCR